MKFTPYCLSCQIKMQRLLGQGIFFKCVYCDKLSSALENIEINPQNFQLNLNSLIKPLSKNNSYLKTPIKPFEPNSQLSSIKFNKIINLANPKNEEERKDNTTVNNKNVIANFIDEFKKVELEINSKNNGISQIGQIINFPESNNNKMNINSISLNKNDNNNEFSNFSNRTLTNSSSVNNLNKINDFSLLRSRKKFIKGFGKATFLGKKRDDSNTNNEFRGRNESNEKIDSTSMSRDVFGTTKPKRLMTKNIVKFGKNNNEINNSNNDTIGLCSTSNNSRRQIIGLKSSIMNRNPGISFMNSGYLNQGFNNNSINGTATPHRLYANNSEEIYF